MLLALHVTVSVCAHCSIAVRKLDVSDFTVLAATALRFPCATLAKLALFTPTLCRDVATAITESLPRFNGNVSEPPSLFARKFVSRLMGPCLVRRTAPRLRS